MGAYKKFKNRSVFLRLFGSYLLILCLILVVEMGVFTGVLRTSRQQAQTLNRSLMQLVKNECDNQIKNIYKTLDLLALDDRVQLLSGVKGEFQPGNQYTAYSLYDELQSIRFSSGEYRLLFVYFKNTDSVISAAGNMSLEMYHTQYYKKMDVSLEELRDYLTESHYHDIDVISVEGAPSQILFTMTSLNTDIGEPTATIAIQIQSGIIDERIKSAKWDDEIEVAVLNSKNEFLNNTEDLEIRDELYYADMTVEESFSSRLGKDEYMGIAMESNVADWIYVLLAPSRIIEGNARQVERYCLIGLGICLILGFVFSYYLTNKNYSPIKGLMEIFRKGRDEEKQSVFQNRQEDRQDSGNEYQWLETQAKSFFKEHEDVRRTLNKNQKRLKEFYLYKLIAHPYEEMDEPELELLNRNGIGDGIWRVVLLSAETSPEKQEENCEEKSQGQELTAELKRFIIRNVAGESLNEKFPTEMLEVGEYVVALVRLNGMDTKNYDKMWEALAKAYELLIKEFHFHMQICAGTAKEGLENVHQSYLEAKETEEYAAVLDTYFINYTDIMNRSKKYYYPTEMETRIMNVVTAGKPEPAVMCIQEVLRINYQENHITSKLLPCLIYDMLGTFMKCADDIGCGSFFEEYWAKVKGFENLAQKSPDEVEEQFKRLICALCAEAESMRSGGDNILVEKIQQYIKENYKNPDLNISQTALYFEKTPAYISSIYKKHTGKSLLKFINQTRVNEAIRLLEAGSSVNETALQAGFRDSRTFIRVFKDSTGLTPGQMKKEQYHNAENT